MSERGLLLFDGNRDLAVQTAGGGLSLRSNGKSFYEDNFRAVLVKRFGKITPADFIAYGSRLKAVSDQSFGISAGVFVTDQSFPTTYVGSVLLSDDLVPYIKGSPVDLAGLTEAGLAQLFKTHPSLELKIQPQSDQNGFDSSFASVEWARELPNKLFFYGQESYMENPRPLVDEKKPFVTALYAQMFNGGIRENLQFSVKLGIDAALKERVNRFI